MGLFVLTGLRIAEGVASATVELDKKQPYLNDHRPGGDPLFGTVMGLEAMACIAYLLAGGLLLHCIESVEIFEPFILRDGSRTSLAVSARVTHSGDQTREFTCEVSSAWPIALHFRCHIRYRTPLPLRPSISAAPNLDGVVTVGGGEIYSLFFHGPSYQVVEHAHFFGDRMVSCLTSPLSPLLLDATAESEAAPQLVEFAMQTAGLLEIAETRRMLIPHRIGRIERFRAEKELALPLYAIARRSHKNGASSASNATPSTEIELIDARGNVHARVERYETVPLPFASDAAAIAALADRFQPAHALGKAT